jgi:solute carrier family 25 carnitine/acylcarnitine transporter 20/29
LLTDIPACGVYFTTYELLVRYQKKNNSDGLMNTIFAGGMAGILNWLIAMPADVLKSRLQTGLFLIFISSLINSIKLAYL